MKPIMDNFIKIYNNAFSDEYCERVINSYHWMLDNNGLRDEFDNNEDKFRNDKCIFMDVTNDDENLSEEILKEKQELSDIFFPEIIEHTNIYLKSLGQWSNFYLEPNGMKVHHYDHTKSGGYYVFHAERAGKSMTYLRREVVYTLYLNDIPEGEGETEFLYQGFRYQPKRGDLVMFPAGFTHTHRGNPVYTKDKYIVTGWMLRPDPTVVKENCNDTDD